MPWSEEYQIQIWNKFKTYIKESNAILIDINYKGCGAKYHVICENNHHCYPSPTNINSKRHTSHVCYKCYLDSRAIKAFNSFKLGIEMQGGTLIDTKWKGDIPYHVCCINGHDAFPRPRSIRLNQGICNTCAGNNTLAVRDKFYAFLEKNGAISLENDAWWGSNNVHKIECVIGHTSFIYPNNVVNGYRSICLACTGKIYSAVYIVTNNVCVKYGITNDNAETRLYQHKLDGYDNIFRVYIDLIEGLPLRVERMIKTTLNELQYMPIKGREYYPIECLPIIIEVMDRIINNDNLRIRYV